MDTYDFMRILGERSNKVERLYYKWAKAHGISYNVLAVLYVACKDAQSSQKVVCEEWSLPKQTVNSVCKDLCAKGYLKLEKSYKDGRETRLTLTETGKELAGSVVNELIDIESRILDSMGEESVRKFLMLFEIFCNEAEKRLVASATAYKKEDTVRD